MKNATSSNVTMSMSPRFVVVTMRSFLLNFMQCPICVKHFAELVPFDGTTIHTHRDAVLWFWRAHNLMSSIVFEKTGLERAFAEDPAFPYTHSWPTPELCPECVRVPLEISASNASTPAQSPLDVQAALAGALLTESGLVDQAAHDAGVVVAVQWDIDAVYRFLVAFYGRGPLPELHLHSQSKSGATIPDMVALSRPPLSYSVVEAAVGAAKWLAPLTVALTAAWYLLRPTGRRRRRDGAACREAGDEEETATLL